VQTAQPPVIGAETSVTIGLILTIIGSAFAIFIWFSAKLAGYTTTNRTLELTEAQKERHTELVKIMESHIDDDRTQFRSIGEKLDDIRFDQQRRRNEE
jgi:hypothetical protein